MFRFATPANADMITRKPINDAKDANMYEPEHRESVVEQIIGGAIFGLLFVILIVVMLP